MASFFFRILTLASWVLCAKALLQHNDQPADRMGRSKWQRQLLASSPLPSSSSSYPFSAKLSTLTPSGTAIPTSLPTRIPSGTAVSQSNPSSKGPYTSRLTPSGSIISSETDRTQSPLTSTLQPATTGSSSSGPAMSLSNPSSTGSYTSQLTSSGSIVSTGTDRPQSPLTSTGQPTTTGTGSSGPVSNTGITSGLQSAAATATASITLTETPTNSFTTDGVAVVAFPSFSEPSITTFPSVTLPTVTSVAAAAETSVAALVVPDLFWLWEHVDMVEDESQVQTYIQNIEHTRDELTKLSDSFSVNPPAPPAACSQTPSKRSFIWKRMNILSGIIGVIKDAATLVNCAAEVADTLESKVKDSTPSVDDIEILSGTLNAIGKELEELNNDDDDDKSTTTQTSKTETTSLPSSTTSSPSSSTSASSSSSSSSSCSGDITATFEGIFCTATGTSSAEIGCSTQVYKATATDCNEIPYSTITLPAQTTTITTPNSSTSTSSSSSSSGSCTPGVTATFEGVFCTGTATGTNSADIGCSTQFYTAIATGCNEIPYSTITLPAQTTITTTPTPTASTPALSSTSSSGSCTGGITATFEGIFCTGTASGTNSADIGCSTQIYTAIATGCNEIPHTTITLPQASGSSSVIPSSVSTSVTSTSISTSVSSSRSASVTSAPSITSCSVTSAAATTVYVQDGIASSYADIIPATSYCACNGGWMAGIGSTIGSDKYTTYTCEVDSTTYMPISTAFPTNVPGVGGLPGCAAIVSSSGVAAYCNCDGTAAPTLSPTSSGFINCDYTIQPTSSYNPTLTTQAPSTTQYYPYATGECNVHVFQGLGVENSDPAIYLTINITDANGSPIGYNQSSLKDWGETLGSDSELPWVMLVTPETGVTDKKREVNPGGPDQYTRTLYEDGPVDFAYASQSWDTSSSQCSVGGWANDLGDRYEPYRRINCTFECPGQ